MSDAFWIYTARGHELNFSGVRKFYFRLSK